MKNSKSSDHSMDKDNHRDPVINDAKKNSFFYYALVDRFLRNGIPLFLVGLLVLSSGCGNFKKKRIRHESYRYELWKNLTNENWTFDFVGTKKDKGFYPLHKDLEFDADHEGTGGIQTDGIIEILPEVLQTIGQPDVVLLGIGGNDLLVEDPVSDIIHNIEHIIEVLQIHNPNIYIFLEQVAPAMSKVFPPEMVAAHQEFNKQIPQLALTQSTSKSKIIPIDMAFDWKDEYMADNVHYNKQGAKVIADRYFEEIKKFLKEEANYKILPLGDSRVKGNRKKAKVN